MNMNIFLSERKQVVALWVRTHKAASILITVAIITLGYIGYGKFFGTSTETHYILTTVQKGTIVSSVTGSGQVSVTNEIDIKPKVSGDVVWVGVKPGDIVRAGQELALLDSTQAQRSVTNAEQALATAKLQYQKDQAQAPIDYQKANDSLALAKEDLVTTYSDTFNIISSTYLDLPTAATGMGNTLYGFDLSPSSSQWNIDVLANMFNNDAASQEKISLFAERAKSDATTAKANYDTSFVDSKKIDRSSSTQDIEHFLDESITTTTAMAQALQSELNLLSTITDTAQTFNRRLPSAVTTLQTNTRTYLATVNTDLGNLLTQKKAITTGKQSVTTYEQNLTLLQVGNTTSGDNPITLQISKNSLASQETNLEQMKEDLANYVIRAPFDGTISVVNAKKGDTAPSVVASIITSQKIAVIALNEVDVAKVKVGQKVTLTFDAIDGLSVAGTVAEIDTVGTVAQGVVTYNVKVTFATQDERIKPGMSTSVAIITAVKQDVLTVPSSAVKTQSGSAYVEVFVPPLPVTLGNQGTPSTVAPQKRMVETGISDDTMTEIISGIAEGDQVVTRTITASVVTTQSAPSLFSTGGRNIGGGAPRSSSAGAGR